VFKPTIKHTPKYWRKVARKKALMEERLAKFMEEEQKLTEKDGEDMMLKQYGPSAYWNRLFGPKAPSVIFS
jgi:hypothetical protein